MLRRLRVENLVLIREADLELDPGLNVVTGETGAGKTILTQAIGLLLGQRADEGLVGPAAGEAYVEAELDLPVGALDDDTFAAVAELRPEDEPGLVVARRVFADGRSRSYAWGRAVARDDCAALVERLVAMSGQFEQRRLARPSHQLELLDAFAGEEQQRRRAEAAAAWRALVGARRALEEAGRDAGRWASRLGELRALVEATKGLEAGDEERLRAERERLRNAGALAEAAVAAAEALAPEFADGPGAAGLAAAAAAALRPVAETAAELGRLADDVLDASERLRDAASELRGFLALLEAEPGRLEAVEEELGRIGDARRRFGAATLAELLERADDARKELAELETGADPAERAREAARQAQQRYDETAAALSAARHAAAGAFADAAREELRLLGLGEGGLRVELAEREPGPAGVDAVSFLLSPNPGLPFAPVAATASGGELSRAALALRVAAHARAGEPTVVFDEIDAGIGGRTAHAVAESLRRLAEGTQLVVITHLPQIASVADRHFRVEKLPGDPTHTRIERLGDAERRDELERMVGGLEFLVGAGVVAPGQRSRR
jgi:DNA repair protein RecN (Recombination protein N)